MRGPFASGLPFSEHERAALRAAERNRVDTALPRRRAVKSTQAYNREATRETKRRDDRMLGEDNDPQA